MYICALHRGGIALVGERACVLRLARWSPAAATASPMASGMPCLGQRSCQDIAAGLGGMFAICVTGHRRGSWGMFEYLVCREGICITIFETSGQLKGQVVRWCCRAIKLDIVGPSHGGMESICRCVTASDQRPGLRLGGTAKDDGALQGAIHVGR